jgi:hypothetical protein
MRGGIIMAIGATALVIGVALGIAPPAPREGTIRVPMDAPSVREAVRAAEPGDLILLDAGTYREEVVVPEGKEDITIRGTDRNKVVFDGENQRANAIQVHADGVVLENMTAHDFTGNGFSWLDVEGFAGRYLTVWNVGGYGIYAIGSRAGLIDASYSSGAADAAFYIGECDPCDTTLVRVQALYSALGYSGTNASGVVIRNSVWELNGSGIVPNSFNEEDLAPQSSSSIRNNVVRDNGTVRTPSSGALGGYVGIGIGIAGGTDNLIEANVVTGNAGYGVAVFSTMQQEGPPWNPGGNVVRGNTVRDNGLADLALAEGAGDGNCFEANSVIRNQPRQIQRLYPCAGRGNPDGEGDPAVAADLVVPIPDLLQRAGPRPDYSSMPAPERLLPELPRELGDQPISERPSGVAALVPFLLMALGLVTGWVGMRSLVEGLYERRYLARRR